MKKWIIALCCVVIAAGAAIGLIVSNNNQRVGELNDTLTARQAEIETLNKQAEEAAKTIEDLTGQISAAKEEISALADETRR